MFGYLRSKKGTSHLFCSLSLNTIPQKLQLTLNA